MIAIAIAAAAAAPLPPVGKWNVDYQENSCALIHQYGEEKHPKTLAILAIPLSDSWEVLIGDDRPGAFGTGRLTVDFGGRTDTGGYRAYPTQESNRYVVRAGIPAALVVGSDAPQVASFRLGGGRSYAFAVPPSTRAMAAFRTCIDGTLKQWGVSPEAVAAVATPAEPESPERYFLSPNDYPADALRSGQQGISVLLWKVAVDGRAVDCRAVIPSSKELDEAGCRGITRRARYKPARDAAGNPIVSYRTRKIVWALPNGFAG